MAEREVELGFITDALAAHRWTNRSRCECGWTVRVCIFPEPQINGLEQFESHVAEHVARALGARTERVYGVALQHGVYETGSERAAVELSGEPPTSGPAVTCLRTQFAHRETPWEPLTRPGQSGDLS